MNPGQLHALPPVFIRRADSLPSLRGNLLSLGARDDAGATPAMAWALEAMARGSGACWIEAGGNFKTTDLLRRLCVERFGADSVALVAANSFGPQISEGAVFDAEWTIGSHAVGLLSAACAGAWHRAGARGPSTRELIEALGLGALREQAARQDFPAHVRIAASSILAKLDGSLCSHSDSSSWAGPFVSILTHWQREFNHASMGQASVSMNALGAPKSKLTLVVLPEEKDAAKEERISAVAVMLARTLSRSNAAEGHRASPPAIVLSGAATPLGWGTLPCGEKDWGAYWAMEHGSVGGWLSSCRGDPLRVAQMCQSWFIGSAQMGGLVESGVLHGDKNFEALASKWRSDVEALSIEECLGPAASILEKVHARSL